MALGQKRLSAAQVLQRYPHSAASGLQHQLFQMPCSRPIQYKHWLKLSRGGVATAAIDTVATVGLLAPCCTLTPHSAYK